MSHFNFQNLTPEEFEALAQDVMQRLLSTPLFRYAAGPDGGIDLCDDLRTNRIIVQCKRYRDYKSLLQSLKEERKKIERLAPTPEKYYVFTSVGLLPQQKKTVLELFQPYMESEANIIDAIAIEDFFNAPQNYDLIKKNNNLFTAYPAGYDQREYSDRQALRDCLDELLRNTWKAHRSYKLMQTDEIDRRLFPNIKDSHQFEALGKRNENDPASPVWSIIRESWKEPKNRPVMIQGKGGIGKTVTLFSLTNMDQDTIPAPAVYVPMFELVNDDKVVNLTDYFQSANAFPSLTPKQRNGLCDLAAKSWAGPSLLVLLDGFNEVQGKLRWNVLQMLRDWHEKNQGAQLIAVSRPMDNLSMETAFGKQTISVTLSELTRESVTAYLKSPQGKGVHIPEPHAPIWETIVYPLFLNLYIKADCLREQQAWQNYPLDTRKATGPGSIIWNYLQRELLRHEDEQWILRCAMANEYFAPILAHHMLQNYDYTISQKDALAILQKAISEMDLVRMPNHIAALFSQWETMELSMDPPLYLKGLNWSDILLRECGLLIPHRETGNKMLENKQEPRFEFLHQSFRDCLAGVYLLNQVEMEKGSIFPESWRQIQSHLALNYAAELIESELLDQLWEANRRTMRYDGSEARKNHIGTCNLLEMYKRNQALRKELNFSGMDLRGLSLARYLSKGLDSLPLFRSSDTSKNTHLDRAVFERDGHTDGVNVLTVLPDGRVVSGSYDNSLRVWNPSTGQCMQNLKGHENQINCIAVLSDRQLVSGSWDKSLRVWDSTTGQCLQTLRGHTDRVSCAAFLQNGHVVSGSYDGSLRVWDSSTGQCLQALEGHTSAVVCAAILPDGCVVSGSWDFSLRVWDPSTGQCLQTLEVDYPINCIAVLPDGRVVSASGGIVGLGNTLRVWDPSSGKYLQTLQWHNAGISCIAVLSDGRVVIGSVDKTLRVWDPSTGQCLQTLEGHTDGITCVAVLPDGNVVSGSHDLTLRVWDPTTGQCLQTLSGQMGRITCVAILPDGRVVSGSYDNSLWVWDPSTGQCLEKLVRNTNAFTSIAVLPDGRVVSSSTDKTLRVWDPSTGQCLQTLEVYTDAFTCIAVLPDGRVVIKADDKNLRVWDPSTDQCLESLEEHTNMNNCVAVLPNGNVVSGSHDHALRVWDPSTDQLLQTLEGHTGVIACVAVHPDGRVVSGSWDKTLRVWDPSTGQCLQTLEGHTGVIACAAILPDGRVVSGSWDKTLRVWDPTTGQCLQTLEGHTGVIACAAILPDGRVVSGSFDGTLRVWDLVMGSCLNVLEATKVPVARKGSFRMDFSEAKLTDNLAQLLWRNGAKIPNADYEKYVKPLPKTNNC